MLIKNYGELNLKKKSYGEWILDLEWFDNQIHFYLFLNEWSVWFDWKFDQIHPCLVITSPLLCEQVLCHSKR